jgi:hypothetical protein
MMRAAIVGALALSLAGCGTPGDRRTVERCPTTPVAVDREPERVYVPLDRAAVAPVQAPAVVPADRETWGDVATERAGLRVALAQANARLAAAGAIGGTLAPACGVAVGIDPR